MNSQAKQLILVVTLIIVGTYFLFFGLTKAHAFLAPLITAILLALLMVPVSNKIESWGISRGWAAFISDLVLMSFFIGLFFIISAQVQSVAKDWPQMKEKLEPKIQQLQEYIAEHTPYSIEEQNQKINEKLPLSGQDQENGGQQNASSQTSSSSSGSNIGSLVGTVVFSFFNFLGAALLTFVYIFFFLLYRRKFKLSILKFIPKEDQERGESIIHESGKVSQNYLLGKLILIVLLAVLYAVGLSLAGIKHAILISILAAVLSLIPYLGNIIGFFLAMAMALFAGGDPTALIGVTITFGVAQFVESYILEPYIVGDQVNIHPIFTIIAVVLGGAVFGVVGMIIAIPIFGIIKVVCDHIKVLHPIGYLLGDQKDEGKDEENFLNKIYEKFRKK